MAVERDVTVAFLQSGIQFDVTEMQLSVLQAFQCHVGLHPGMSAEEIRSDALGRCREGQAVQGIFG